MLVLVHNSPTSLERDHGRHPNLGVLSCPERTYLNVDGWWWAADNRAYSGWDEHAFLIMVNKIRTLVAGYRRAEKCLFVAAPDVVADHAATLERFHEWREELSGLPVAFVLQDGCTVNDVPWPHITAVFIGGSSEWKFSPQVRMLTMFAHDLNKWVHMGRVNTQQRVQYAHALGCDSIDGTNFSMYRRTNLPWALDMCSQPRQTMIA